SDRPSCARTARSIEARDTHTWVISARGGFRVADTTEPREGAPVVRSALEKITLSDMIEQRSGRIPRALYDLLLNPQSLLQSSNLGLKTGNARALGQKVILLPEFDLVRSCRTKNCYQSNFRRRHRITDVTCKSPVRTLGDFPDW
ncbi:hypothetical protein, partial [Pseudomonas aeruginosa]|uniref:hypothetical protein n=1 Tax=Pseudomonas aeruginosa TaxID=287 RepID=UPI001C8B8BE6